MPYRLAARHFGLSGEGLADAVGELASAGEDIQSGGC